MKNNKISRILVVLTLAGTMATVLSACQQVNAEDIEGLLQAVEGREMVIKLDDGTVARITVNDNNAIAEVNGLIGKQVDASVSSKDGQPQLEKVEKRAQGEDQTSSGTIESISSSVARIGGRNFKIIATTELDGGLVAGATARVEFITLADGTLMATQIETDKQIQRINGAISTISDDKLTIDGQNFHLDDTTHRSGDVAAGQTAHVEFVDNNGVKHVTELEPRVENSHLTGTIQSISSGFVTVDGRTFKINAATVLDSGLAVGVPARLEFITMADGQLVATDIETDEPEVQNEQENEHPAGDDNGVDSGGGGNSGKG